MMNPESWQKLKTLFHAAVELEPTEATYLAEACEGDSELRKQVEKLLASHHASGSFLGSPANLNAAIEATSSSMTGRSQFPGEGW